MGMRKIQKPAWLLFGEECRDKKMPELRRTKDGKREEDAICRWLCEAREKYQYPGTEYDWFCLVKWPGRR
jgi:hypothetical protein